jgi:hypothetical protein
MTYNSYMMIRKGDMKEIFKSKSQVREETKDAVEAFLRAGGSIQVVKARKAPKTKMKAKTSRGFAGGSSGFSSGYSRSKIGG